MSRLTHPNSIYIKVDATSENIYSDFWFLTFAAISATSVIDPDKIVYHISLAAKEQQLYLQLIIVDRYEYDELSTSMMESLRGTILNKFYESELMDDA